MASYPNAEFKAEVKVTVANIQIEALRKLEILMSQAKTLEDARSILAHEIETQVKTIIAIRKERERERKRI
jgi:hypothetical protein